MVVNDLDVLRTVFGPNEAHSPLAVDTNAVLPFAIAFQSFKDISRRDLQIIEHSRPVELGQFAKSRPFNIHPTSDTSAFEERFGILALETLDRHSAIITRYVISVNQSRVAAAWLCGLTSDLTGAHEASAQRPRTHLCVRVEGTVRLHFVL